MNEIESVCCPIYEIVTPIPNCNCNFNSKSNLQSNQTRSYPILLVHTLSLSRINSLAGSRVPRSSLEEFLIFTSGLFIYLLLSYCLFVTPNDERLGPAEQRTLHLAPLGIGRHERHCFYIQQLMLLIIHAHETKWRISRMWRIVVRDAQSPRTPKGALIFAH